MSEEETAGFLNQQRTVICATAGPRGWPHLMPLWYVVRDGELWAWTYTKSQKVRNLERSPQATLQIEDGKQYNELKGVMIEAETIIHRPSETVAELGAELLGRYGAGSDRGAEFMELLRAQAAKRVALQFVPRRFVSWDHGKLGGVY